MELGSGTAVPYTVNASGLGYPVITPVLGSWLNVIEKDPVKSLLDQAVC